MGCKNGAKGPFLCIAFPFAKHLNSEMFVIGVDELTVRLTNPDAIGLMPTLFWSE